MVDLGGYVIILVETKDKKIKLYGVTFLILRGRAIFLNVSRFLGSPADKDNLEVGDEILEVNGKTLEDATHTEVINHIHQVGGSVLFLPLFVDDADVRLVCSA